jgi:hypothetical protein
VVTVGLRGLLVAAALVLSACSYGSSTAAERTDGDGWRLLGIYRTDVPYTVRLAQDPMQLADEFAWHDIDADVPEWNPDAEAIAFFSEGIGSSCPEVAVSDITFDDGGRRVYATFVDPVAVEANTPRACTADLVGSQTAVVALARDHLASQFTLSLEETVVGCHPDCGSGPTEITVNLE